MSRFNVSFPAVIAAACLAAGSINAQAVPTAFAQNAKVANPLERHISLDLTDVSVLKAVDEIAGQAGVRIVYVKDQLASKPRVSIRSQSITAGTALERVLKNTGLMLSSYTGALAIVEREKAGAGRSVAQGVVTGKVTDSKSGRGIAGASVSIGTAGVTTGEDGSYRLANIAAGTYSVSVRLVGYAKQTRVVTVGEGATVTVDFKLEPSANVLDQVIVTGTVISTEIRAVPSAITVVTAKQIEERGITRIDQLFRGDIPGIAALEQGANATLDEVVMYSRGSTKMSTATIEPGAFTNPIKTYIDGVELSDSRYLSQIDPKSIERIEILTGPQASTIYGANAINGVMQIFTKRGSTVRPVITLSLIEGLSQNNFSSALSPSHQYDGSASGAEGKISYNVGSGWNYTGAWSTGRQMQRTSVYGGTRYQAGAFSIDLSARQGWTQNKVQASNQQGRNALLEQGRFDVSSGGVGIAAPRKLQLSGRTLGAILGYTPFSWWSHQINIGSDASDTQNIGSASSFFSQSDTNITGNNQNSNVRISQSYASTFRIPINSILQTTLTYGADHWRTRTSTISWTRVPATGSLTNQSVTRPKPSKNSGMYVQGQLGLWESLFLTYGIRADWNPNYGERARVLPGRYGASYSKDVGVVSAKLRGSYGRSIRPPAPDLTQGVPVPSDGSSFNANDLAFYAVPGSTLYRVLPSPDLGPEFQQGGEGGIELYFGNRGSLVITRYNQTVDGLINSLSNVDSVRALQPGFGVVSVTNCFTSGSPVSLPQSDGYCYLKQSQNINVGSIRNQGWELQGSVNTGPFTTRGTYSWVKSRMIGVTRRYRSLLSATQAVVFSPGQTFSFVPEHTWGAGVSYNKPMTSVSLNINGLGRIYRRGDTGKLAQVTSGSLRLWAEQTYMAGQSLLNIRLPQSGYTTANMNASHHLSEKAEAILQITNLTNYYQNDYDYRYPTLGRQTNLGIRVRW